MRNAYRRSAPRSTLRPIHPPPLRHPYPLRGPISIGGFNVDAGGGGSVTKNHPVVGRVPNGAIVQQEMVAPGEIAGSLTVTLGDPDYTTVARLARSVDIRFGARIATALDKGTVQVRVPRDYQNPGRFIDFISQEIRKDDLKNGDLAAKAEKEVSKKSLEDAARHKREEEKAAEEFCAKEKTVGQNVSGRDSASHERGFLNFRYW